MSSLRDSSDRSLLLGGGVGAHGVVDHATRRPVHGQVIYPACRACVVYDGNENRQRFNLDHTDDICSFAVHPNGKLAATGEVSPAPSRKEASFNVSTLLFVGGIELEILKISIFQSFSWVKCIT